MAPFFGVEDARGPDDATVVGSTDPVLDIEEPISYRCFVCGVSVGSSYDDVGERERFGALGHWVAAGGGVALNGEGARNHCGLPKLKDGQLRSAPQSVVPRRARTRDSQYKTPHSLPQLLCVSSW